jgi:hypothetical protein
MKRKPHLTIFGLVVVGLVLFALLAHGQSPGAQFDTAPPDVTIQPGAHFDTAPPGVAIQNDKLFVALPLVNTGAGDAMSVIVTGIHLGSLHRVRPADLPFPVGDIAAGQSTLLQLGFIAPVRDRPAHFPLHVHGKYTLGGKMKHFEVHVMIRRPLPSEGQRDAGQATVAPQTANGAIYPPSDVGFHPDENNQEPGPPVPEGERIGSFSPDNPPVNVATPGSPAGLTAQRALAPNDPITFVRVGVHQFPNTTVFLEPSGASVDFREALGGPLSRLVFLTGNTYALLSTNGGNTFTQLDPTTIFPNYDSQGFLLDGGLCCDQVIHYIPSINRVVWLMQFTPQTRLDANGNKVFVLNRLRLASASPSQIIATGGTAWTYWDMTSATFGLGNGWMDYPDLAWTGSFLHISVDSVFDGGLFVIRAPLTQIQNSQNLNLQFTTPSDGKIAWSSHLAQDSPDAAYWFGRAGLSSTTIFEWLDNSGSYSWQTLNTDSWQNDKKDYPSLAPNGVDWLGSNNSSFLGATVREDVDLGGGSSRRTIMTAHGAGRGGNFPQPYIRLLDVVKLTSGNQVTWSKTESQIWNSSFAFALPYLATNTNGEVGISVGAGGGGNHATPLAGFVGDSTLFYTGQSTTTISRWGDYSAIRRHWQNPKLFSVTDYFLVAPNVDFPKGQSFHQYRLFGRTADVGGTF